MTTPTDAELIERLNGMTHSEIVLFDEWLYKGQPLIEQAAARLAALVEERTKAVEAFADMCVKYHTLTLERDALGECFKELRDETLKLRAEHDRLQEAIVDHIQWWYEPASDHRHSEEAYGRLREALKENQRA